MLGNNRPLGPYILVRVIGAGAFAKVWLGELRREGSIRQVAVKIPEADFLAINKLKQNAELWKRVSKHPNILPFIEVNTYDDTVVLVSEYAEGGSLQDWLKHQHLFGDKLEEAIDITAGVSAGLEYLHSSGIIHRDIKPSNILLNRGTPLIADFDFARFFEPNGESSDIRGTPDYMSPEAIEGKISPSIDLWSVAVIFYYMITGEKPFAFDKHRLEIRPARGLYNDRAFTNFFLKDFFERSFNADPDDRFQSAGEMREALRAIKQSIKGETVTLPQPLLASSLLINETKKLIKSIEQKTESFNHLEVFRARVLKDIIEELDSEITGLLGNYEMEIASEKNFLLRAQPLFHSAKKVYATSLDNVSTFWTKQDPLRVADYINGQPPMTVRLFVFSSPKRAHYHLDILQANHIRYGSKNDGQGAVLVCSLECYKKLLNKLAPNNRDRQNELLRIDFGLLEYADNSFVEAKLDSSTIGFKKINLRLGSLNYKEYTKIFEKLRKLPEGEIDNNWNILRWSPEFSADRDAWASRLKKLFGTSGETSGDTYHLVFFSNEVSKETVIETKQELMRNKELFRLVNVWYGTRTHRKAVDGKYRGELRTGARNGHKWEYMLLMQFENSSDLDMFLGHPIHSDIRRKAFSAFSGEIKDLYEKIDQAKNEDGNYWTLSNQIEDELAPEFFERRDFLDTEQIDDIVMGEPYRFYYEP